MQWAAASATVAASGFASAGAGVGHAGHVIPNNHIALVDVTGPGFEGMDDRNTRFQFFDNVLFAVTAPLNALLQPLPKEQRMSDAQIEALRQRLTRKFGPPAALNRFPGVRKPDVFVWKFGANELQLDCGLMGKSLSYYNTALAKKAHTSTRRIQTHPTDYQ